MTFDGCCDPAEQLELVDDTNRVPVDYVDRQNALDVADIVPLTDAPESG